MKKNGKLTRVAVCGLITALSVGNIFPALAQPVMPIVLEEYIPSDIDIGDGDTEGTGTAYVDVEEANTKDSDIADPDIEETEDVDIKVSTPSNASSKGKGSNAKVPDLQVKDDIFEDMPEIGTDEFTEWFFRNAENSDLWEWVSQITASPDTVEYVLYMDWYETHAERVDAAMQIRMGISLMSFSTGDLWGDWTGDMDWQGEGTESGPYQITSVSELMGFSELVASGTNFKNTYFELTNDIDLGSIQINSGSWNPIGWYQNASEMAGDVSNVFSGNFDGAGNTISGLRISNSTQSLRNIGLFGAIEGGSIKNLTIEAEEIYGNDNAGILAGMISKDTTVYNVTVKGYVFSAQDAGGIAGEIAGGSNNVTIENCTADGVVIYSKGTNGFVGGIVGNASKADLIDNTVYTYDGDGNRIAGKGYVGGIAGRMKQINIYNSYVGGTIGGNGSVAAGGLVGKYESGNLILGRFAGDIGKTNNGTASREGTFVGTRGSGNNFTYGTGSNNNLAYLFTTSASKAKVAFGSNIDGDNSFTRDAHIGYWSNNEKSYYLVAGKTETLGSNYFYEELEAGIKHVITQKLNKEFTASGYYDGFKFRLDHYAPGFQGEPVRGYLVSVPRIDALNANGTYDTDVATLTAMPVSNNSFYRQIDKDHPAAVAYGVSVSVSTAAKNSSGNRYQMVYNTEPTYTDEHGDVIPMTYASGGTYTFVMPECDTELKVQYEKVTTELTMTPAETTISVTQTRSGDRKNPTVTTEVKNQSGILIARYIGGVQDTSVEVQPVSIHAEHNNDGSTVNKTVQWSVDDTNLITSTSESGYTLTDAKIMPNLQSNFIQNIITQEVQAQANAGYANSISNTVYRKNAVVTATTNPETTVDNRTVYGNTKVTVSFQIIDLTTIRVEGLALNKSNIAYTVTRTLSGDRLNPTETITCSAPVSLTATLNPNQPFLRNATWSDQESGKIITLAPSGDWTQDCSVAIRYDSSGQQNPVWIQNVINADNAARTADPYRKLSGSTAYTEKVTAVSEDQTHGHVMAECDITINFATIDNTVIHPESVSLDKNALTFDLTLTKTGRRTSPTLTWIGQDTQMLQATMNPNLADSSIYKPYDKTITWSVSNAALNVVNGNVSPNLDSEWIKETISKHPYIGTIEIPVQAKAVDNGKTAVCMVTVNVKVVDNTYPSSSGGGGGGGGSSSGGGFRSVGVTTTGNTQGPAAPAGSVTGTWTQTADGRWIFATNRTYTDEWAYISNPYSTGSQPKANWFRFSETGHMVTGWYTNADSHVYYLNPISDNTQGAMFTGWHWISGKCYFFTEIKSDTNPEGSLMKNATTPEGYTVNTDGVWVIDGVIQTQ
ncbi:hypothetical protein SAMN05443270_3466 [Lacrimispora sphenoides]|uniref:hypothetical protein n=1 Tax=Lacrimispora sphenoides TaxID=29370 RepID=UPI0008C3AD35|nr:hypothetical protein [Lacrimispora sphenoides]SEU22297.1 hypothetical protein SAMN05443270_3466 [Lacrimispora sphenoides]